ncbi:TraE/TraK family type IV conjugative transfer system protein [Thorsellia anophelis]|uniref:Conjugal transfer pilus assembly protein TraE n=1 Tax=Thorsellia anophelis DSM 18579 TaxID=1123402 RepID=A0A1I0CZ47_9GAMM|nr:TraE/TraK family type IV conjugative transfer system protein [Thorsellia anophelis]SET25134.1 conjugal transfer pilus assembly protein TraE [Thorsellia anophelis DSM 18579]
MKFFKLATNWQSLNLENRYLKVIILFLFTCLILLCIMNFNKEVIVTLVPPNLSHDVTVKKTTASKTYLSSWALYFADLIGNVSPGNVTFIEQAISPMLAPEIYQLVIDVLLMQTQQIQDDNVTLSFQPRQIETEENSDKIFVTGYSFISGLAGKVQRELRTYEFIIQINQYAPTLIWMDTYEGQPKLNSKVKG